MACKELLAAFADGAGPAVRPVQVFDVEAQYFFGAGGGGVEHRPQRPVLERFAFVGDEPVDPLPVTAPAVVGLGLVLAGEPGQYRGRVVESALLAEVGQGTRDGGAFGVERRRRLACPRGADVRVCSRSLPPPTVSSPRCAIPANAVGSYASQPHGAGLTSGVALGQDGLVASTVNALVLGGAPPAESEVPPGTRRIALAADGLWFMPVTRQLSERMSTGPDDEKLVDGFYELTGGLARWARRLSHGRQVLYIHSEFFGGAGLQATVGWKDEEVFFGPSFTCTNGMEDPPYELVPPAEMAINAGLRALGVACAPGEDEYATVGLEAHRWRDGSISG